jgi:hypothetical protein
MLMGLALLFGGTNVGTEVVSMATQLSQGTADPIVYPTRMGLVLQYLRDGTYELNYEGGSGPCTLLNGEILEGELPFDWFWKPDGSNEVSRV